MRKKQKVLLFILSIMMLITGCSQEAQPPVTNITAGEMKVTYIYIDQGDATLIQTDDAAMLIDTGDYGQKDVLLEALSAAGLETLDYLILTHPDSDHIGAGDVVIENYDVKSVIMPDLKRETKVYQYVMEGIGQSNLQVINPEVGQKYELGDAHFTILGPYQVYENDTNNSSVSIKLAHGDNTFLFTGDAEEQEEKDMAEGDIDLECDVLKCGHHGSRTATSDRFLEAADPTWAVISCGKDNQYGFPHADVMAKLEDDDIQIYRTDTMGTVTAVSNGSTIMWNQSVTSDQSEQTEPVEQTGPIKQDKVYILNTNTKKIHQPDCSSVPTIADQNRQDSSRAKADLEEEGYSPCQRCNP